MQQISLDSIWAKTIGNSQTDYHGLLLHMLDVAAAAEAVMELEPVGSSSTLYGMLKPDSEPHDDIYKRFMLALIAMHDIGKACPGFQHKWAGAPLYGYIDSTYKPIKDIDDVNHAWVSHIYLSDALKSKFGLDATLADNLADSVGCHHGKRANNNDIARIKKKTVNICDKLFANARDRVFDTILSVFDCHNVKLRKNGLSGPEFMMISGLCSFADWIGSDDKWFTPQHGLVDLDTDGLRSYYNLRYLIAKKWLEVHGWHDKNKNIAITDFKGMFGFDPRPLQISVAGILDSVSDTTPSCIIIEAPMGEGKTEAALYAYRSMLKKLGHRGLYVALPTKATGNSMYSRVRKFLNTHETNHVDLQLCHGASLLNNEYQNTSVYSVNHDKSEAVECNSWFTNRKRAMLSENGVGTIDQALLSALPVKHHFVRLWGLSNKVIILDEVHAYDAYTSHLLKNFVHWALNMGSSVVLLSATLPVKFKKELSKLITGKDHHITSRYPLVSVIHGGEHYNEHEFNADSGRSIEHKIIKHDILDSTQVADLCRDRIKSCSNVVCIVNTVQRAQCVYNEMGNGSPIIVDGVTVGKNCGSFDVYVFHARYESTNRQKREDNALRLYGKSACNPHGRKSILIATQVVEQSLDIDFDVMITDMAPIDLVLQRAGRLWRHKKERTIKEPELHIIGSGGAEPGDFETNLYWSLIYNDAILIKSWYALNEVQTLSLPNDIQCMMDKVYNNPPSWNWSEKVDSRFKLGYAEYISDNNSSKTVADGASIGNPRSVSDVRHYIDNEDYVTRLGEESITVVPLRKGEKQTGLNDDEQKSYFLRSLSISKKLLIQAVKASQKNVDWNDSKYLKYVYLLDLDLHKKLVYMDDELGLVYT